MLLTFNPELFRFLFLFFNMVFSLLGFSIVEIYTIMISLVLTSYACLEIVGFIRHPNVLVSILGDISCVHACLCLE